jgi:ribosome-binding protein aMBF1 (putative translation factor)
VLEEREVELQSAIPAQEELIDSYGNMLQPAIEAVPAVMLKQVKLRAQYTVEIVDITEEVEQQKINQEALAYLAETDWMVIRQMDSGEPMPAEVKAKRAEARAKVKR